MSKKQLNAEPATAAHDYRDCRHFNGGCCSLTGKGSGKLCVELMWNLAVTVYFTADELRWCRQWKMKPQSKSLNHLN